METTSGPRCYAEGLSKAQVRSRAGSGRVLNSERSYLLATLPAGVATALVGIGRGPAQDDSQGGHDRGGSWGDGVWLPGRATRPPPRPPPVPRPSRSPLTGLPADRPSLAADRPSLADPGGGTVGPAARLSRASVAALPVALLLWVISLFRVDLGRMSDLGLVSVLPVTFWLALALLTTGFVLAVTRQAPRRGLLVAYAVSLVLVLHATPTLLYDTLRYAWAWKHVGLIDYLVRHGSHRPPHRQRLGCLPGLAWLLCRQRPAHQGRRAPVRAQLCRLGPTVLRPARPRTVGPHLSPLYPGSASDLDRHLVVHSWQLGRSGLFLSAGRRLLPVPGCDRHHPSVVLVEQRCAGRWRLAEPGPQGSRDRWCRCAASHSGGPAYSSPWWCWS